MRTVSSVTDLIGKTPMLRLSTIDNSYPFEIWAKCEFMNPSGSVKDRMALYMIKEAEERGELRPDMRILVPTTGNTGISFAWLGKYLGYEVIIVMPEEMSYERKLLDKFFGAKLRYTPGGESDAMEALKHCRELAEEHPQTYWVAEQWNDEANVKAHYETTGKEILAQSGEEIDLIVAGIGTGGTLIGIAKRMKDIHPDVQIVALEPAECPTAAKWFENKEEAWGRHEIEGIGDGFVPSIIRKHKELIDNFVLVGSEEAIKMAETLAQKEGLAVGISSGANIAGILKISEQLPHIKRKAVTVLPDYAARYFSTRLFLRRRLTTEEHKEMLDLAKW
ncbi:MAG: cysteine synthase family protein [Candidatus Korarchaeota archaeon]|nr:cysteine synthase family protein [Candidatus Korarchaeota archaeon]NIU84545.1 pyridoxal-phosphate dependent enzyme [Candidatus Thorarchaeota archaeon]NIW14612.1 pyridoxal-phosphate dependent enzyme [Candidatus Thorarchaeota archaeon]NIW52684.1 pyridoxal-phosphate dependent enzyme [Candidatus Korarchaeota archaeon]